MQQISISELKNDLEFGLKIFNHNIKPRVPFVMGVVFKEIGDPRSFIAEVAPWDGQGGDQSMRIISFH